MMLALLLTIVGTCGAGILWNNRHYLLVDFQFYPRDLETLDLREEKITVAQYERFRKSLPECEILWNVPFQGTAYAQDNEHLTISSLSDKDVKALDYFPELKQVDARECWDYDQLLALQQRRPEVEVLYTIAIGQERYDPGESQLTLSGIAQEDIPNLAYFENLQSVVLYEGGDLAHFGELQECCRELGCNLQIWMGETLLDTSTETLELTGITNEELNFLACFPALKQVTIRSPKATLANLEAVRVAYPQVDISWTLEVCGKAFDEAATEIDISGTKVEDLEELARQMTYFPKAEKLIMSDCGVDNEAMAAFREEHRQDYKVVWTVQLGDNLTARTDDTTFMPVREKVYYFQDHESGNLKYCEDMVCIDVGHMAIHNIDFVECMPDLEYLILAHTEVRDITPIKNCKKLKFLELDHSTVRDFTPLLECTALEDLNVGNTYPDLEPLTKMTWLKNLWMVGRSGGAYAVTQALTDTKIVLSGSATVAGGWRELPNYFAMRDLLGMEYMSW